MTFVVAAPCIKCKYTDCVEICPVMCFHEGANSLVIDPDECIDCGACVDHCPVKAIYDEDNLPEVWHEFTELNAQYAKVWPVITRRKDPLDSADSFKDIDAKRDMLDPAPGTGDK